MRVNSAMSERKRPVKIAPRPIKREAKATYRTRDTVMSDGKESGLFSDMAFDVDVQPELGTASTSNSIVKYNPKLTQSKMCGQNFERPFSCDKCEKCYVTKRGLWKHISVKHRMDHHSTCEFCDCKFTTKFGKTRHMERIHKNSSSVPCSMCKNKQERMAHKYGKTVVVQSNNVSKVIQKRTDKSKPFQCDICHRSFLHRRSLDRHRSKLHNPNNRKVCPICNLEVLDSNSLNRHISHVHEKLRPFQCSDCDRLFASKYNCELHIRRTHKNSKHEDLSNCPSRDSHDEHISFLENYKQDNFDFKVESEKEVLIRDNAEMPNIVEDKLKGDESGVDSSMTLSPTLPDEIEDWYFSDLWPFNTESDMNDFIGDIHH